MAENSTAIDAAHLAALHAINAALEMQTREIQQIGGKVDDMQIRLIRVEEAKHGREIERLTKALEEVKADSRSRLTTLELANATRDGQIAGASKLANFSRLFLPWVLAGAMALFTYLGLEGKP